MKQRFTRNLALGLVTLVGAGAVIVAFVDAAPAANPYCADTEYAALSPPPETIDDLVADATLAVIGNVDDFAEVEDGPLTSPVVRTRAGLVVHEVVVNRTGHPLTAGDTIIVLLSGAVRGDRVACGLARIPRSDELRLFLLEERTGRDAYVLADRHGIVALDGDEAYFDMGAGRVSVSMVTDDTSTDAFLEAIREAMERTP